MEKPYSRQGGEFVENAIKILHIREYFLVASTSHRKLFAHTMAVLAVCKQGHSDSHILEDRMTKKLLLADLGMLVFTFPVLASEPVFSMDAGAIQWPGVLG